MLTLQIKWWFWKAKVKVEKLFSISLSWDGTIVLSVYLHKCYTHVVGQFPYPSRESFGVCLQVAPGVPLAGGPAVVDADVLITGLLPALLHHHICHLHVQTLAAGTGEDVRGWKYHRDVVLGKLIPLVFLFMIYWQNTAAVSSDKMTSGAVSGFCAQEVRRRLLIIISEEQH